jgi:hypothetical protein
LYQSLLQDASFFDLLLKIDRDLAAEAREGGCTCGGALHRANYERKPSGGPPDLDPDHMTRFSFCCAREGCRRRLTPRSLRFLGRRVFFAVVVLLVPVLRDGPTPVRMSRLCEIFAVSVRSIRRWRRFWREAFARSRVWRAARRRFTTAIEAQEMPRSLIEAFSGLAEAKERVIAVLRLMASIEVRFVLAF